LAVHIKIICKYYRSSSSVEA